jgi:DNA polymerase-1
MEVRVIAALSKEETLLEAYRQGKDIHRYMASKIFNKPEEKITDSERRYSKTLTFSVIYGKGVIAIARDSLQGDIKKAEDLYNGFFNGFPGIDRFKNLGHKQIEEGQGEDDYYVESLLGEKIPLIGNKHGQNTSINQLKRLVVNYPVQSTASHLTAIGINRVNRDAYEHKLPIRAFGFTHDAGDFDFMTEYLFKFIDLLIFHMQDNIANEFNIPVKIDMEIGKTGNCMLELKIKEKTEEKLVVKFGGSKQALDDVTGQFNKANMTYELLNVESKESYVSWDGLFSPKRAYSQNMGKTVEHVEGEMVIFKN